MCGKSVVRLPKMANASLVTVLFGCLLLPVATMACSQGSCTLKARACVDNFFDGLKSSPLENCSLMYAQLVRCTNKELCQCLKQAESKENSAELIRRAHAITATEKYFCEDGLLNTLEQYNSSTLPGCREKFFKKAAKCSRSFQETFRQDKGSNKLCRKYSKAKKCLKRALEKSCSKSTEVKRLLASYNQQYNPYCPGKVDPRRPDIGACTKRSYLLLTRMCVAGFIKTMQDKGGKNCGSVYTKTFQPCVRGILFHCLKDGYKSSKALYKYIDANLERSRAYHMHNYCYGKGLSTPHFMPNQCKEKYPKIKEECEKEYLKTYRENIADKSLCRKYTKAKKCNKNATMVLCEMTPRLQDEMEFLYDRFNPFCFNLIDPPMETPAPRKPRNPGTSRGNDTAYENIEKDNGSLEEKQQSAPSGAQSVTSSYLCYLLVVALISLAIQL